MPKVFKEGGFNTYTLDEAIDKVVSDNLLKSVQYLMKKQIKTLEDLSELADKQWYEMCEGYDD